MTDHCEQMMEETQFVVKATYEETFLFWEKFCVQTMYKTPLSIYTWEQCNPGWHLEIGKIIDYPVCIGVRWYRINGVLVMFYEATSRIVDHEMVDKWLKERCCPKDCDGRLAYTNALNFHHVLDYIKGA